MSVEMIQDLWFKNLSISISLEGDRSVSDKNLSIIYLRSMPPWCVYAVNMQIIVG